MALSGKYGKLDIPKIGEDEPVFILRAQDSLAAPAIHKYQSLATANGLPIAKSVQKEIDLILQWKGTKKLPD